VIIAILLAAAAPQAGCADHWQVRLNSESFANNGAGRTFSASNLAAFRAKLEAQLRSAIGGACAAGAVPTNAAKAVRMVEAISASGATEPHLYARAADQLALEWIFAEEGLAVPPDRDIVAGAACWTDPTGETCASEGD